MISDTGLGGKGAVDDVGRWFLGQRAGSMNQIRGWATGFS